MGVRISPPRLKNLNKMEKYHGNTVEYWKQNVEEDYLKTPISVLRYITVLEEQIEQLRQTPVSGRSEQFYCDGQENNKDRCETQCLGCAGMQEIYGQ